MIIHVTNRKQKKTPIPFTSPFSNNSMIPIHIILFSIHPHPFESPWFVELKIPPFLLPKKHFNITLKKIPSLFTKIPLTKSLIISKISIMQSLVRFMEIINTTSGQELKEIVFIIRPRPFETNTPRQI